MAELELAKHGKNVVNMAKSKEHHWTHKAREIALEVAIIVFAVSISIWFHSMSEHRHEQKQVKSFLLGLKTDLTRDIMELNEHVQHYRVFDANYAYLAALDPNVTPDGSKFDEAYALTNNNAMFSPVNSRFEGFKSSGKLTNIEDEELLNDILTLYEQHHRAIGLSEGGWGGNHGKLRRYLDVALEQGDSPQQRYRALTTPNAKRMLRNMASHPQLYERYKNTVMLSTKIIQRIDAQYPPG